MCSSLSSGTTWLKLGLTAGMVAAQRPPLPLPLLLLPLLSREPRLPRRRRFCSPLHKGFGALCGA